MFWLWICCKIVLETWVGWKGKEEAKRNVGTYIESAHKISNFNALLSVVELEEDANSLAVHLRDLHPPEVVCVVEGEDLLCELNGVVCAEHA